MRAHRLPNGCLLWDDGVVTNADGDGACALTSEEVTPEYLSAQIEHADAVILGNIWFVILLQFMVLGLCVVGLVVSLWKRR